MVAMSGGVDSSVAAALLDRAGYLVCGATMRLFDNSDIGSAESACCSQSDVDDARGVAARLGVEFFVFNFSDCFRQKVMDKFASEYAAGRTPNPCIDCNRYLKFGALLERALLLGWGKLATGHYARTEYDSASGRYLLKTAADPSKDQSYVLYSLTQKQLSHMLFPLGNLSKNQVRDLAEEFNFQNAQKPESQDICFVPDGDYPAFLRTYTKVDPVPGNFVDRHGKVLGTHRGISAYTVGQRRGLGLPMGSPVYVLEKDPVNNQIIVGESEELFKTRVRVGDINYIALENPVSPVQLTAKIRYNQTARPATLYPEENGIAVLEFTSPQRAAAPGQAAVFYDGDVVFGGGTIL